MPETDRLRGLIDAGIALGSELSLDALLQKLVTTAADLTGARYAALGVIDESGEGLQRFIHTGMEREQADRIGELPRGRGILGALITDARSLRLDAITDDPRSAGFPPHHPPMRGFLGVPILLRGRAYGNLYLTEKADGPFSGDDQELVETLAGQAAVAIENARLLQDATNWSAQLEALNEVGAALASELDLPRLLQLICRRLRSLIGARVVTIALPASEGMLRIEAADGAGAEEILGLRLERAGSKSGGVLERRSAERVDAISEDPEIDQHATRPIDARTGLYVPLIAGARPIGVIVAHDKEGDDPRFDDNDLRLAETFATRAAVAVDLSSRVARDALRRVVAAQELERRRLARELHDQTGQELTSVLLGLKAVDEAKGDAERAEALQAVREQVVQTLARRAPAGDRASAEGARRLRAHAGARTPTRHLLRADRNARRARVADPRAPAGRRRNRPLSHRPGGADQRCQARPGGHHQHRLGTQGRSGHGADRRRRPRLHP